MFFLHKRDYLAESPLCETTQVITICDASFGVECLADPVTVDFLRFFSVWPIWCRLGAFFAVRGRFSDASGPPPTDSGRVSPMFNEFDRVLIVSFFVF